MLDSATFQAWTPRISVQGQASSETFVYLSATRGFKSGGFNPTATQPGRALGPESAWSYEAGLKRTTTGGRVRANAAAFYTDYRDLQVQTFIRPAVLDISNAASATIRGIEVELAADTGRGVQLAGHISWLDATYDRYVAVGPAGVTRNAAGNQLNNAPEWSGSGSAVYEFAAGRSGTATLRGDVSWQSRVFFTPFNDAIETQPAYRARAPAGGLRAAKPPMGDGRLRAQRGQHGVHHRHRQRPAPRVHGSSRRPAPVGDAVHATSLTHRVSSQRSGPGPFSGLAQNLFKQQIGIGSPNRSKDPRRARTPPRLECPGVIDARRRSPRSGRRLSPRDGR